MRTQAMVSPRKVSDSGMTMACACRSANKKLHSGNSLIVCSMTRDVAQK